MADLLAWFVDVNSMTCIVFATTSAKAKWVAVRGYWDAGYGRKGTWPPVSIDRAERFDHSPLRMKKPQPWTTDYVADTLHLTEV